MIATRSRDLQSCGTYLQTAKVKSRGHLILPGHLDLNQGSTSREPSKNAKLAPQGHQRANRRVRANHTRVIARNFEKIQTKPETNKQPPLN